MIRKDCKNFGYIKNKAINFPACKILKKKIPIITESCEFCKDYDIDWKKVPDNINIENI